MPRLNKPRQADDVAWRQFPQFEASFSPVNRGEAYARIERTCRKLDALIHSDSPEDRTRATVAMNGFARLLELVDLVTEQQAKAAQP